MIALNKHVMKKKLKNNMQPKWLILSHEVLETAGTAADELV